MWGQVATSLVKQDNLSVTLACKLFDHHRQSFYQLKSDIEKDIANERRVLESVCEIRAEDPGIGAYKLWLMMRNIYGYEAVMGRDRFYVLLRRHKLMLPPPKVRHTTNSNHRYHKWKNLIKGISLNSANELWVADITYIWTAQGVCYLHLITDAYSHKIIGWVLTDTLKAAMSIEALQQAIDQAVQSTGNSCLKGLIHHSDRGVQYCCDAYVEVLKSYGISISMTEDYKPTNNAIAERVNGIIKEEYVYRTHQFANQAQAKEVIGRYIQFYNNKRPHMSIGYKTPAMAHQEKGPQQKKWKKKKYDKKQETKENKIVTLQRQTTSQVQSTCQQP